MRSGRSRLGLLDRLGKNANACDLPAFFAQE